MSWLSSGVKKLAKGAKRLVTEPGKWAENAGRSVGGAAKVAAPFLPPGFRQLASIGGSIAAGGNMQDHIKSGIGAEIGSMAGGRAAGSAIGKAASSGGLKGVVRALPGVLAGGRSGAGGPTPPISGTGSSWTFPGFENPVNLPGMPQQGGGFDWDGLLKGLGGVAKQAGGFVKDNALDIALAGLATAQGVNSAKASARQGKLSDEAIRMAKERWASQAPMRERGMLQALNPTKSDLSGVYNDPQNPFAANPIARGPRAIRAPGPAPARATVRAPKAGGPAAPTPRPLVMPQLLPGLKPTTKMGPITRPTGPIARPPKPLNVPPIMPAAPLPVKPGMVPRNPAAGGTPIDPRVRALPLLFGKGKKMPVLRRA